MLYGYRDGLGNNLGAMNKMQGQDNYICKDYVGVITQQRGNKNMENEMKPNHDCDLRRVVV